MRKAILTMVMASLCLVVFLTTGCNEEKDLQLGKMEEQIKSLRLENARLKKEVVITEINDTGTDLTFITLAVKSPWDIIKIKSPANYLKLVRV